jgi:molecular chaperone DnaK
MDRQTVDFGIDLGTTNSAIARATPSGVRIIKNRLQHDTTPSAVARTRAGQTLVGEDALNKSDLGPAVRFKRIMGTDQTITLADGSQWRPEMLSAEVLKELRSSSQRRFNVEPDHVVITVPAMFQQPQCEATHRAAETAGLNAVSLLQEPIAAATAFLHDDPREGNFLVYDLGGGTFDVSIVRVRDNEMSVVAHGGDNFLGGSDFDRAIRDDILDSLAKMHGRYPELERPPLRDILLRECEKAKERLTDTDETYVDLSDFNLPVAQMPLSGERLADLITPLLHRTLRHVQERLDQARLPVSSIAGIMLVGGPTMMPIVRQRLTEAFDIPLLMDQDPMTVVAVGAAVTASTILRPNRTHSLPSSAGHAVLELFYEPVSPETRATVAGRVVSPPGFTGDVRLSRESGDWDSGWIALRNAAFTCDVALRKGATTDLAVELRDSAGSNVTVDTARITIRHGISAASAVVPFNFGVALSGGDFDEIVRANQPLPAAATVGFISARTIAAGSPDELLIYFLEGKSKIAADNMRVGEFRIRGVDLPRTLREGDRVDVRVHVDESRRITARVSIPLHDLDFSVSELSSMTMVPPTDDLLAALQETQAKVEHIEDVVGPDDESTLRDIKRELEYAEADYQKAVDGDIEAGVRIYSKMSPLKADLRELLSKYEVQAAVSNASDMVERAQVVAERFNDQMGLAELGDIREDIGRCARLNDAAGLNKLADRADNIHWRNYVKTRECWVDFIAWLRTRRKSASDILVFDDYMKRASDFLMSNDLEGARINSLFAHELLPVEKEEDGVWTGRFDDAGLRRHA